MHPAALQEQHQSSREENAGKSEINARPRQRRPRQDHRSAKRECTVLEPTRPAGQRSRQSGARGKREEDVRLTRGPWKRYREDRLSECSDDQKPCNVRACVHTALEVTSENKAEERKGNTAEPSDQEEGGSTSAELMWSPSMSTAAIVLITSSGAPASSIMRDQQS
jgi:hypothetical protein